MFSKRNRRQNIRYRIRKSIKGTSSTPRLSIFRSNKSIYCQLIDDVNGHTIASASSKDDGIGVAGGSKSDQAKKVGLLIADKAKSNNISNIVFDRAGYLYHGRVKSLAEGAREGGLSF
jgi:large subunit ribosomal protein L18